MTQEKSKDAGLALVLICLLMAYFTPWRSALVLAIFVLVLVMTAPAIFSPFARVWYRFSHILGEIVSRILLTLLFFVLVVPVGLARNALGKDAMQLKAWRRGGESVFRVRDHHFTAADMDKPY